MLQNFLFFSAFFQRGALCISGSRDRILAVWDVNASNPRPLTHTEAHKGWIWGLASKSQSLFYTCSWDCTAKLWTLDEGRLSASDTFKYAYISFWKFLIIIRITINFFFLNY